jgi:hypothetical protein
MSTIGVVGSLLQGLLLLRGIQTRLVRQFPVFYSYMLFVFVQDFLRAATRHWYGEGQQYAQVYWITQFIALVMGSGVIFEIYRVGLRAFPGAAKMTRYLLLIVFGTIFAKTLAHLSGGFLAWIFYSRSEAIEWSLRTVQGTAILTLAALFLWYAIPFGRNLKGILWGYGLFVGMSIAQFTLLFFAYEKVRVYWGYGQPVSYVIVLGVWVSALWSEHPVPGIAREAKLESDYEALVATTRRQLDKAMARLGWATRV